MRRTRAVGNQRKTDVRCSAAHCDNIVSETMLKVLNILGSSGGETIQELRKKIDAFIASGRGHAVSSKDATGARESLARERQYECEAARDENASPACRSSDPESCLSRILSLSSAGAAGGDREKAEPCLLGDNKTLHPELTFVHVGDGDARLVELVRLLARRAARKYYEERKEDQCCRRKPKDRSTTCS